MAKNVSSSEPAKVLQLHARRSWPRWSSMGYWITFLVGREHVPHKLLHTGVGPIVRAGLIGN
jgi:hypothetical protein